ncbi:hypothetical protein D3C79_699940 [compost metagenome]
MRPDRHRGAFLQAGPRLSQAGNLARAVQQQDQWPNTQPWLYQWFVVDREAIATQGQVTIVGRIIDQHRHPALVECQLLFHEPHPLGAVGMRVKHDLADTAFVHDHRAVGPDRQESGLPDLQTKVHIVIGNSERLFIQPTNLLIDRLADHQARRGDRTEVLVKLAAPHVAGRLRIKPKPRMLSWATQSQHHTRMLQLTVRIMQTRANDSHFRALGMIEQFVQPVGIDHFGIVVQQHQVLAARSRCSLIVHRREIERVRIAQHANPRIRHRLQPVQPVPGLLCLTLVVDQDDFEMRITGTLEDAFHAPRNHGQLIAGRHQDRHQRALRMAITQMVSARSRLQHDAAVIPPGSQVTTQCAELVMVAFALVVIADQQQFVTVANAGHATRFDHPQYEVQLRSVRELGTVATKLNENLTADEPVLRHAPWRGQ